MAGLSQEAGKRLLLSGEDSDFTIKCQEVEFKVHKLIIKADSDFCRAVCDRPFKESEEACVSLPDDEPEIVARVLQYLYTGAYTEEQPPEIPGLPPLQEAWVTTLAASQDAWTKVKAETATIEDTSNAVGYVANALETHAKVYVCADKLGVQKLCAEASEAFQMIFPQGKKVLCEPQITSLLSLVYDTTPSDGFGLRYYMTAFFLTRIDETIPEAVFVVIKQHEPMMARLGFAYKAALDEVEILKHDNMVKARDHATEVASLTGSRDDLNLAKTVVDIELDDVQVEAAKTRDRLKKLVDDTRSDHEKEMRYIDHALSEIKVARYCGYCGDKDSLTTSRQYNSGSGKKDVKLTCPSCKEWRFIERLQQ